MDIKYEKIEISNSVLINIKAPNWSSYEWESAANDVVNYKEKIKKIFRLQQKGSCCYCRRFLRDDIVTDLEHFVEKSVFPAFRFEIRNLALSCRLCNNVKNAKFRSINGARKRRAAKVAKIVCRRCLTLSQNTPNSTVFPNTADDYRWVHPHFDRYSEHISIRKNWIFTWRSRKGFRTVRGLNLNALHLIERRALQERFVARKSIIATLIYGLSELESHDAKTVALEIARQLGKRLGLREHV